MWPQVAVNAWQFPDVTCRRAKSETEIRFSGASFSEMQSPWKTSRSYGVSRAAAASAIICPMRRSQAFTTAIPVT